MVKVYTAQIWAAKSKSVQGLLILLLNLVMIWVSFLLPHGQWLLTTRTIVSVPVSI